MGEILSFSLFYWLDFLTAAPFLTCNETGKEKI